MFRSLPLMISLSRFAVLIAALNSTELLVNAAEPEAKTAQPATAPSTTPDPASQKSIPVEPLPLIPGARVVTLWPAGHATLKDLEQKEVFTPTKGQPERIQAVVNVHNPSIELHLAPKEKANGTAIILAPGGGNTQLVVGTEGTDVATWLNEIGISAFILRYRLRPYGSGVEALADTQRSVRLVRANAKEWGVDPAKVGIMGFSAGGEQVARLALNFDEGNTEATDPIEKQSDRPDFAVLIYPGWGRSMSLGPVPKNAPPTFITSAGLDDASHAKQSVEFYNALFEAKVSVELHIYGHGGHGNGIKSRDGIPFGTWQNRFIDWAVDLKMLKKP